MGKKSAEPNQSKSLKTFYLYSVLVVLVICISLVVKGFLLFQQNVFDPSHQFTLAVLHEGTVKEIISFNPEIPSIAVLKVTDKKISYKTLAQDYGITSEGYMQIDNTIPLTSDITALMWSTVLHTGMLDTNLTPFDAVRLFLVSKNVATNNEDTNAITLSHTSTINNSLITQTLTDTDIASESVSIQIINATNISGVGQRLGKVLTNMGANVVDVSSAQSIQSKTTIAYYGGQSYTLDRLQKLLAVQPTQLTRQPIANIVITIGTDQKNTTVF